MLELMLVLSIAGILALIAYPSYQQHLARAYRQKAKIQLIKAAQELEIYFSEHRRYTGALFFSSSEYYQITVARADEKTYLLEATPNLAQAKRDSMCGVLSMDDKGRRGISGGGKLEQCWN